MRQFLADPRFHAYMVAIWSTNGVHYAGPPEDAPWDKIANLPWVAHNSKFDRPIFEELRRRDLVPQVGPSEWHCSMALAATRQIKVNLKNACKHILDVEISKDMRGKAEGLEWPHHFTEEERAEMVEYAKSDALRCAQLFSELWESTPPIERRLAQHTDNIPFVGIHVDKPALKAAIRTLTLAVEQCYLAAPGGMSTAQLHTQIRKAGGTPPPSTNSKDPSYLTWAQENPQHAKIVEAVQRLRSANKTLELLKSIETRLDENSLLDAALKYYGANVTGRWSGTGGINMQNLPKGEIEGISVRHLFTPRPKHKFIIADLSAIEPRVLNWLIDNVDMLAHLRDGQDLYEAHARATMNYKDPRPLKSVNNDLRQLAKIRVLALGYGMGPARFLSTAQQWGIPMDAAKAKIEVAAFRSQNPGIVRFWKELEKELAHAMTGMRPAEFTLPSGRVLRYFNIQKSSKGFTGSPLDGEEIEDKLYGGLLCENVVQATSRDVLGEAIVAIEEAGIRVLWHVHDEIIAEVPEDEAEECLAIIKDIMTNPPTWAAGLPLAVDAHISDKYDK